MAEDGDSVVVNGLRLLKFVLVDGERALRDISGELCVGWSRDGRGGGAP